MTTGITLEGNNANNMVALDMATNMIRKIDNVDRLKIPNLCFYRKRITFECQELLKLYISNISNFDLQISENNYILSFNLKNHNNDKNDYYEFIINEFPCKSPIIKINKIPLINLIAIPKHHTSLLKEWKGIQCFCCNSFINNWSALISINSIVYNVNRMIDWKECLNIIELIEKIKDKYLITDINLISYIYA
jgi:hypothetical protein